MYKNGKIYKIVSDLTDKIYIGSTVQPLYKRYFTHKKHTHKCSSIELIKLGETRIELIEDFPCERKEQLNAREGYYIKLYKDICVNVRIAGRTDKEYREDNKERIKQYANSNKERIIEQKKNYRENNKERISEQKKRYYQAKKASKLLQQQ